MLAALLEVLMTLFAPYELSFRWCGYTHGVPPWLLKGMAHETSHFSADAAGPTGDHGVMQVIESNAPGCGLTVADLDVPAKNICCAAWLMDRNLSKVRSLGATGRDAYKLALARNNLGGGNVDGVIAAGATTWEAFVAATPQWPGKHDWINKLWERSTSYRLGEYAINTLVLAGIAGLVWYVLE